MYGFHVSPGLFSGLSVAFLSVCFKSVWYNVKMSMIERDACGIICLAKMRLLHPFFFHLFSF